MNIDKTMEEIAQLRYGKQVDVRDAVMQRIEQMPTPQRTASRPLWLRWSPLVAAAAALLFAVGIAMPYLHSYDEEKLSGTLAQLSDYGSWNTVESSATNPYEYLYE